MDRFHRQFGSSWPVSARCCERSGRHGDSERHEIAISHINIAGAIRLPADVTDRESPRKERVRGVGYLDLVHVWMSRVVEGGILLVSRLTRFHTMHHARFEEGGGGGKPVPPLLDWLKIFSP